MSNQHIAEKSARTEKGNFYSIIQDGPNSFHISVSTDAITLYEHFKNVPSLEYLEEQVLIMEAEASLFQPSVEPVEVTDSSL